MTRPIATGGPGGIVGSLSVVPVGLDHMALGPFVDGQFLSHVWLLVSGVGAVAINIGLSMSSSDDRSDDAFTSAQNLIARAEATILGKPSINFSTHTNPSFSLPVALGFAVTSSRRFLLVSIAAAGGTSAGVVASVFPFLISNVATPVRIEAPPAV